MPAWLAPVCDSGRSPTRSADDSPAAASGHLRRIAVRIARCRTGAASPSISRKMIPGLSVLSAPPWRRATGGLPSASRRRRRRRRGSHGARGGGRDQQRREHRIAERVDLKSEGSSAEMISRISHVERQHDQKTADQRERESDGGHQRRQDRIEQPDESAASIARESCGRGRPAARSTRTRPPAPRRAAPPPGVLDSRAGAPAPTQRRVRNSVGGVRLLARVTVVR